MKLIYVYSCLPIDFWHGWHPLQSLLSRSDTARYKTGDWSLDPSEVRKFWELAQILAKEIGWAGDIREGPFWIPLPPLTGDWTFAIAWKQDNNGDTFVASPFQLPWLHKEADRMINIYRDIKEFG